MATKKDSKKTQEPENNLPAVPNQVGLELDLAIKNITQEWLDNVAQHSDGLAMRFDRVKNPSGGALFFEVPGEDEDSPDAEKTITGVIVDHYPCNAYWKDPDGAGTAPDCSAIDGKYGYGDPGGYCAQCPMNKYGSDIKGTGKACKNSHRVFLLQEDSVFPLMISVSPMSIKNISGYILKRIIGQGLLPHLVMTEVSLRKATNKQGTEYAEMVFKNVGKLKPDDAEAIFEYAESIKPMMRELEISDEVAYDETSTADHYRAFNKEEPDSQEPSENMEQDDVM